LLSFFTVRCFYFCLFPWFLTLFLSTCKYFLNFVLKFVWKLQFDFQSLWFSQSAAQLCLAFSTSTHPCISLLSPSIARMFCLKSNYIQREKGGIVRCKRDHENKQNFYWTYLWFQMKKIDLIHVYLMINVQASNSHKK